MPTPLSGVGYVPTPLSGVGYVPTPNVHSDVWDCVESYAIHMLLARRLMITFRLSLNSFTSKSVPAGTKLVLFGRYILKFYVRIVQ